MSNGSSVENVLWRLRDTMLGEPTEGKLYECRRCGFSMEKSQQRCPECGSAEIAQYEFH